MRKLAVVASHPIQYQAPLFRALAASCDLTVFFCHRQSAEEQGAAGFGRAFDWDVPLLDGYRQEFLENISPQPGVDTFSGCDTPAVLGRLSRGGFDACLVSGWHLKSYIQAMRAAKSLGVRLLVRGDSHLAQPRSAVVTLAKYLPYRWMLSRIDANLYVGLANYEYLRHYGVARSRLFFAPHFIDNDRFARGADLARSTGRARELRGTWGAQDGDLVFAYVGKLIELKQVADFVVAVGAAARHDARIRGVIIGSGPDESSLRRLSAETGAKVAFAGFCNQADLPAHYAAIDNLVLPSRSESWGLVVNEAMAVDVPAIVSDAVGSRADLIEEGLTGFAYPAGDVRALAARIAEMAELLSRDRRAVTSAVRARIGRYRCENAVAGVLEAMSARTPLPTGVGARAGVERA